MPPPRPYTTRNPVVDNAIASLVKSFGDEFDQRLLAETIVSIYRLGQDEASTGDLKLVNTALKELRYAFKIFRPYRHLRKVAMFGSARVSSRHPAYAMAKTFGRLMVDAGWTVITGAASGIMRAGHEGAGRIASFGLNIRLPFEQEANPVIAGDTKLVNFKYFFTRKLLFIKESHATALFPGGFGTLDEGFESLTLVQTGKSDPRPIVFVDTPRGTFWDPMLRFFEQQLIHGGMISASDRAIYQIARSPEEAAEHVLGFYRVYHSQRYVGDYLVLRLHRALDAASLRRLNQEFRDILRAGTAIRQGGALPQESDEPKLQDLPRLILKFTRKDFGRLVGLIHRINELG
ncbi:MAG: TIGR00730 family Rossman fold protein [Candidatus Omnitrophica bacterium CG11_big_fil_rev_8_21_14_0_20_63_9]|nr:MAG: TIGR00730 family Rossman fold protein [Candidatus Omnitrophica bacterium CG11_big_fil_rev_8_21_14_0_20_63_9]